MSDNQPDLFSRLEAPARLAMDGSKIYTVSALTREIRDVLEEALPRVWIEGEISNLRRPASGHCYFTLKDDNAQISVVMWRGTADALRFEMKDGLAVVIQGELTVYEPRGQYQVVARRAQPCGVGALQLAFTQLKEKLQREGLFDAELKKPLPLIPRRIAIITSPTGAAIRDMLNVIERRFPGTQIVICPARVQGNSAAPEIATQIARADRLPHVDVIIVGRGGGSMEDLWPFNEEIVARAIAAARAPVVSAVGHETDFTIADFVADLRALTPTDAGTRVVPEAQQLRHGLGSLATRLGQALLGSVNSSKQRLEGLARSYALRRPMERIHAREQRLDELAQRLLRATTNAMRSQRQRFDAAASRLDTLSPLGVLRRGYSVTQADDTGRIIDNAARLKPGDIVRTRLAKGEFRSQVLPEETPPPKPPKEKAAPKAARKRPAATKKPTRKRRSQDG